MKINVDKINWMRIEQGLTLTKLCEKSKVSIPTITRLLKAQCDTRPDTVGKIAIALNVPVKDLFLEE